MIRRAEVTGEMGDVVPQAIIWRPMPYFTIHSGNSSDELDEYVFATFEIGNWLRFDIRNYAGHPAHTVTVYLPLLLDDQSDIQYAIRRVIGEFRLPNVAVAWRRGIPYEYGILPRRENDRLREPEARLLVLKIAALMPNQSASTQQLINETPNLISLSEIDLMPSQTRPLQPRWHQIIRNVISHRDSPHGPFVRGYATRTPDGLVVTEAGIDHLRSIGYLT